MEFGALTIDVGGWSTAAGHVPTVRNWTETTATEIDQLDVYEWGGGANSAAGELVTSRTAFRIPAVWQAVDLISGAIAKLPLRVYRRRDDGSREVAYDHAAFDLVRSQPNAELDYFRFWRRVIVHRLIWQNAYVWILRDQLGRPLELIPLLPDRTRPVRVDGLLWYVTEISRKTGIGRELVPLDARDVIHLEGLVTDPEDDLRAQSLVKHARDSWGKALAALRFSSTFFKSGGRIGGTLIVPPELGPKAQDTLEKGFRRNYERPDSAFKVVVLRDGAKFERGQFSAREAMVSEGYHDSVRDVARYFNIAPSRLGDDQTTSFASKSEDNRAFLEDTLDPYLVSITAQCDAKLLTDDERRGRRYYHEHVTAALLRLNTLERYQVYQIGVAATILSPNDCRELENMNPRPGGDTYENPNTSSSGSNANTQALRESLGRHLAGTLERVAGVARERRDRDKQPISKRQAADQVAAAIRDPLRCYLLATGTPQSATETDLEQIAAELARLALLNTQTPNPDEVIRCLRQSDC